VLDTEAPRKHRESIRLAFTGELPKEDIVRLAGGPLHKTLAPLIPTRPAKVGLRVRVHGDRSPTPDKYEIETDIEIPGPFKAWGQPFENFKGTAFFDSGNLCVDIKEVAYAGGRVATTSPWASNRAWLDSRGAAPLLTLDFKLTDARRSLLFENLKELAKFASAGQEPKKITTPQKKKPPATSPFSDDVPDNSQLMVTFNGSIVTNDFKTLAGKGHIVLADPNIPHLYIFGGLSRILSKIKFGFSDFKLDRAETDYTVRDCTLFFPDLRIKGADAEIESKGEYDMLADKMRFVAILNSRVGESVPVVGLLPKVLNKWTNLGLVRITGPLSAPDWSLDATPSGLFRDVLKSEKLGTPREPLPAAKP
jgi:hypothetical protein